MQIQMIQVPYDSAHRSVRMGKGPEYFIEQGADEILRQQGHDVDIDCIEAVDPFRAEIATAFELNQFLADRVKTAITQNRFPLVLSGNCNTCLGTIAGIQSNTEPLGMIWFDGHGDFDTPETSINGFLDGMGIAMATGRCWKAMTNSIANFRPVLEENIVLVGAREFDPEEIESYQQSKITVIQAESMRQKGIKTVLEPALNLLRTRVEQIYLHLDLDVLDPEEAKANEFAPPEGLTTNQVEEAIRMVKDRFTIAATTVASFDPEYDEAGRTFSAGIKLMKSVVAKD